MKNPGWICFAWFGMTGGASILTVPARAITGEKVAPAILDAGQEILIALNQIEFVALILLLLIVRVSGLARRLLAPVVVLALILLAQSIWVLPEMSAHVQLVNAGPNPPAAFAHSANSILELTKLILLTYTGIDSLRVLAGNHRDLEV